MSKIIKKFIKPDKNKVGSQVIINIKEEDDIQIAINQSSGISQIYLTYNQLCSLNKLIHQAIDDHYKSFSSTMIKEKTQTIYFDDPVDW